MSKIIYVIAGCNGAGKTTASFTILPEILNCKIFVNADEIAKGLSPFQPEAVAFEAGRIMIERINAEKFLNSLMNLLNQTQIKNAAASTVSNDAILNKINEALIKTESVAVAFPPCSDVMLGLIDSIPGYETNINNVTMNHLFAE